MCGGRFRECGIRMTWRHLLVLGFYLVILFKAVIPLLEGTLGKGTPSVLLISGLVSFPLLALLEVVIDRAGPLRNWSVSFLLHLLYPALALNHDAVALGDYLASGKPPAFWTTILLNATLIPVSIASFVKMVPKPCPGCGKRSLIPLMRLFMKDLRTTNTRWCASCGGKFWKDQEGNWRVERRKTWLDRETEPTTLAAEDLPPAGQPEVRSPSRRSLGRQTNEVPPAH